MIETRPVTEQLLAHCQSQLAAGSHAAGERFPTERELARRHKVSRTSANKVLAKLVSEGWLEIRRGQGTFVAERPGLQASLRRLESFTAYARAQGFTPSTQVLSLSPADVVEPAIRQALRAGGRERLLLLCRVRRADGEAVIHEERWLPARRYPRLGARACAGSFYQLCRERYGFAVTREAASIRARLARGEVARHFGEGAPVLLLESTGFDEASQPAWYQRLHYSGERFALVHEHGDAGGADPFSLRLNPNGESP